MSAPLTPSQIRGLAQLARLGWERAREQALASDEPFTATADDWRHDLVARAVSKAGLRCCSQDDYADVKGAMLNALGQTEAAMQWHVRAVTNPARVAFAKLAQACREAGVKLSYAEAICRSMHKHTLAEASAGELWKVFYAVRNRRKSSHRAANHEPRSTND